MQPKCSCEQHDTTTLDQEPGTSTATGLADPGCVQHGDPGSYEWHTARAREAIDREELNLAHAHLYLAAELQDALVERARTSRAWQAAREAYRDLSPGATARLWRMIENVDQHTAETPLVAPHAGRRVWTGNSQPVHLDQPTEVIDTRRCVTCAGRIRLLAGGWWHLDSEGVPMIPDDRHQVVALP